MLSFSFLHARTAGAGESAAESAFRQMPSMNARGTAYDERPAKGKGAYIPPPDAMVRVCARMFSCF
eukprot:1160103-Pelagomonas_calceolata.AAC.3